MRRTLALAFLVAFIQGIAQKPDTTLSVHGRIILANRGFAPVPAFSFNSPIAIGFLAIKKKAFSYDPDAAVGLNGKPWMANHWFRYSSSINKNWQTNIGLNPSLFFKNEILYSGDEIVHAHRNLTFEAAVERRFSAGSLRFSYMLIHAFDKGTLSGHFLDVSSTFKIPIKKLSVQWRPELFYFNFDGTVDGVFSSLMISAAHSIVPVSIYFQGVAPIWSDFEGDKFKWNTGIVYTY